MAFPSSQPVPDIHALDDKVFTHHLVPSLTHFDQSTATDSNAETFLYASNPHACTFTGSLILSHQASSTPTYLLNDAVHLTPNICKTMDEGSQYMDLEYLDDLATLHLCCRHTQHYSANI